MSPGIGAAALAHAGHAAGSTDWIGVVAPVVVLLAFIFGAPAFWVWAVRRWRLGEDDSDDGDGQGGGGQGRGPTPPARPPDSDPIWWPEFERQFAAHVQSQLTGVR
jgi:hypothetical protein